MKFKIDRPPKHIKWARRREWHEAFAWTWQKVDCTDEGHSIIWFEKYMRQERQGASNNPKHDGVYWRQYSTKTYFKKKLNGDFEVDRNPWDEENVMADTDTGHGQTSNVTRAYVSKILKKGGPHDNNKYKKILSTVTRDPKSGTILSVDTKEGGREA